jgi:flagellar M-ring protein FliF
VQEKAKSFLTKGKQWWGSTTKKRKIWLGSGFLAVLLVVLMMAAINLNRPYVTLFTGLNQTDMSSILSYLSDAGITDYQIKGEDTILVPEDQEVSLKAALLSQNYPSSGFAYSTYFDHIGSLTTESERNTLILYELQDRTAAVIRSMEGVQDAVVQFTPGEDRTYVLDSGNVVEASAYVMVTMEPGKTLETMQAKGIRNLLSRSLQGLSVENISIVDSYGNPYLTDDGLSNIQDTSALKMQLEAQVDNKIRTEVMKALLPLFGEGNVQVSVNSIVNVDRTYTDSTDYSLEDWAADGSTGGEGIIGKKIYDQEVVREDADAAGGVAGTQSNADVPTYPEDELQTDGTEAVSSSSGEKDYLVDETNQQVEHVAGTVSDVMVSVTINERAATSVQEEELYPHVARAAGIGVADQMEKIHILVAPFYQEETASVISKDWPAWVIYAGIGGLVLFLVILMLILLLVGRRKKKGRKQAVVPEPVVVQKMQEGANIMDMRTEKSVELRKDVRKFAEENPEIAAQMVKSWLREGSGRE